jgi:inner membrane transporter RhtA
MQTALEHEGPPWVTGGADHITQARHEASTRAWAGPALMLGSGLSNQLGAAAGAMAFPVLGPVGVVAVRQWIAGITLLAAGRPRFRSFTWAQWWPVLLLAAAYGTMNLSLYSAIDRLGLGLAVTLEFLGPLTVAIAASRRRVDLACALVAGAGVVALTRPRPATDYAGLGLALLAAACWASYILLNRLIGRRLPGTQGTATAAGLSALVFVPVGIMTLVRHPPTLVALAYAGAAGILSSAVPLIVDLSALRRVPARYFGIFMSVNPVLAAIVGLMILGQSLSWSTWLSIAAIVAANAANAVSSAGPAGGDTPVPGTPAAAVDTAPVLAIRADREDHGHRQDDGASDTGRAEPLPQDEGSQDRASERFEQGQQGGGTRGGGAQTAEVQRVGHRGRTGPQCNEQSDGVKARPEAQPAGACCQREQDQSAEGKAEPGYGQVIQPGHRPGPGQRDRGKACRREHRHARAGQDRALAESRRQAHEQAEAGQGQTGGPEPEPAGSAPGGALGGEHEDGSGTDGDQGGQRYRGQRHRGEVKALV